jgi:predicted transcriptional regulator
MIPPSDVGDSKELSQKELNLIERFEAAYNAIDRQLRKVLGKDRTVPFSGLVNEFERKSRSFADDADYLKIVGALCNVLIHEKTEPYKYLAVPIPMIVERLEAMFDQLSHPALAIPTFKTNVETVSMSDSLANVLKKISYKDYSQFPVYSRESFKGLLTENGITRWLAHHVSAELSLVDLEEVFVEEVLRKEEVRENYIFVPRNKTVDKIKDLFASYDLLEAVLITEKGNKIEKLMGIATRWDILKIK